MLKAIDIVELLAPHPPRTNFNILRVDGTYALRVARIAGEYPWHIHEKHDEAWVILKGRAKIRTEDSETELTALNAVLVPAGTLHSPVALADETTVLIVNGPDFATSYSMGDTDASAGYREVDID